jgi:hypothetical protein
VPELLLRDLDLSLSENSIGLVLTAGSKVMYSHVQTTSQLAIVRKRAQCDATLNAIGENDDEMLGKHPPSVIPRHSFPVWHRLHAVGGCV